MYVNYTENLLGAFEKKVSAQKVKFCQNIPVSFFENLAFLSETFFSKAPSKFSVGFTYMFKVF